MTGVQTCALPIYVDEDRPGDVVDAVEEIRDSPGVRAELSRLGRERAAGRTWDACVEKLASALGRPRDGGRA